jgi:hypothetical protein
MTKRYDIRISENLIANMSRWVFAEGMDEDVISLARAIPKARRYVIDAAARRYHKKMVEDEGFLSLRSVTRPSLPHDVCWVEYLFGKGVDPALPLRAGILLRKLSPEQAPDETRLNGVLDKNNLSHLVSGHVITSAIIEGERRFLFDPFRIVVPVGSDGVASDHLAEMLVTSEDPEEHLLIRDVARVASRVVALALHSLDEARRGELTAREVVPDDRQAKTMLRKENRALLMPHVVLSYP